MLSVGDDIWRILAITPGVMSAHYSIEFRTHFTGVHTLVVGFIGATEQLCIVMAVTLWCALSPGTNGFFLSQFTLPFLGYQTNYRDIIIFFSFVSGVHYNLENIFRALYEVKNRGYALGCLPNDVLFLIQSLLHRVRLRFHLHEWPFPIVRQRNLQLEQHSGHVV